MCYIFEMADDYCEPLLVGYISIIKLSGSVNFDVIMSA